MKKLYLSLCILSFSSFSSFAQTAFTSGNIVVYKVGDGAAAPTSAAGAVTLDEYKPDGTLVSSHPMPTTASGSNKRIVASGSASSEGLLTRSSDKQYLVVSGYDAAVGTAAIASTASATTNRVVGIVKYDGSIDATTALSDAYSANNFRGAVSSDGNDIWVSGTGSSPNYGVRHTTKGSTTSTVLSTTVTNIRSVNIFNNQLYVSSGSGAFLGVSAVGTGLPTTTGNTIALLSGFPTSGSSSPYEFSISPAGTTIYVGDDRAVASSGGVQKWVSSDAGATWTLSYTLNTGLTAGARGIAVDWSGTNPVIYATTSDSKIVSVTDAGSASSFATLATAATNYVYRGIALAPIVNNTTPVTLTRFNAIQNNTVVNLTWATAQELNTKSFEIERSIDGVSYTEIGSVNAANNSTATRNYSLQDIHPVTGINYYKLKTIDNNGAFSYSTIQTVNYSTEETISIFPNPAQAQITVAHPANKQSSLLVTDLQGKTIKVVAIIPASTTTIINIETLTKGQYFIKYMNGNTTVVTVLNKL